MKFIKVISLLILFILSTNVLAQDNDDPKFRSVFNLKSDQKITHGGYGAFGIGHTIIDDKSALRFTIKGAWIVNHRFALGLAGNSFFNNLSYSDSRVNNSIGGGYGGIFIEPILFPMAPVHVTFPLIIGGGSLTTLHPSEWYDNTGDYSNQFDVFFVVEPGIEIEINMIKFFRIGLGASYRFTNGINLVYSDNTQVPFTALDSFNLYANFKFGKF